MKHHDLNVPPEFLDYLRLGGLNEKIVNPSGEGILNQFHENPPKFLNYERPKTLLNALFQSHTKNPTSVGYWGDVGLFAGFNAYHPEGWHRIYNAQTGYQSAQKFNPHDMTRKKIVFQHRPQNPSVPYIKEWDQPRIKSGYKQFEENIKKSKNIPKLSFYRLYGLTKLARYVA